MVIHFLSIALIALGTLQGCLPQVYGNEENYKHQPAPVYIPPGQGFESALTPAALYASDNKIVPKTSLVPVRRQDIDGDGIDDFDDGDGIDDFDIGDGGGGGGGGFRPGIAAAIAIPIAVAVPLGVLGVVVALPLAVLAVAVALAIGTLVASVIAISVGGLIAGTIAFLVISGSTIAALIASGGIGLLSILGILKKPCPYQKLITPCTCTAEANAAGVNVATINCPSSLSITALQAIFKRIPSKYDIDTVNINFQPGFDANVPANLLGSVRVRNIKLIGSNLGLVPITIDALAFWTSKTKTTTLTIQQFNLATLNWKFLTNFNALTTISIVDSNNINQPPDLPPLPNLNQFLINNVNKWPYPPGGRSFKSSRSLPLLSRGLTQLVLNHSLMSDDDASVYLKWVLPASRNTLKELILDYNSLTKIPNEIASFTALDVVSMKGGDPVGGIFKVTKNSFDFKQAVKRLDLSENKIHTIEPGSFKGDFREASVILTGNQLTSFQENVFRGFLEQMSITNDASVAFVDVAGNPFDCESDHCHLAWILRDNKEYIKFVKDAACSNGSTFETLDSHKFNDCPLKSQSRNSFNAIRRRG